MQPDQQRQQDEPRKAEPKKKPTGRRRADRNRLLDFLIDDVLPERAGRAVRGALDRKLVRPLGQIVLLVLVQPLFYAYFAALWTGQMPEVVRGHFTRTIQEGFRVVDPMNEAIRASNKRLDYLQSLDFTTDANRERTFLLSAGLGQKIVLHIVNVQATIGRSESCQQKSLPDSILAANPSLLSVSLAGAPIGDLRLWEPTTKKLQANWWRKHGDEVELASEGEETGDPPRNLTLRFAPTNGARSLWSDSGGCAQLSVQGSLAVYKEGSRAAEGQRDPG